MLKESRSGIPEILMQNNMPAGVEAKVADPDRSNGLLGALESHIHRPTDIVIRTGASHVLHPRLEDLDMLHGFQKVILNRCATMECFEGIVEPDILGVEASDLLPDGSRRHLFVEFFEAQYSLGLLLGR